MGCCGGQREKGPKEESQKWEYLTLSDFKATSSLNTLAYAWVWFMAFVHVAVFAADTYTAVNLLAFNKWSSQIEPTLPLKYSRWIFAGCILFSWLLAIVELIRAVRVIKRGGVAESYMDPLAVTLLSIRTKGWRRFLVFTELTKSKKGVDYIAFFVYFSFKGAVRIILAEGPRQVINGMTLEAVMVADLFSRETGNHTGIAQLWINIQYLFDTNKYQAATMVTMLFTLTIWVISALSLLAAVLLYIVFLWHYIPQSDGRLSIFCRRKIDRRLEKIVESKVKAAIEDEERKKRKAEQKADLKRQKTGEPGQPIAPKLGRQPTLPQLGVTPEMKSDEKMPDFPGLSRQDTMATVSTLPPYTSRPPTRNDNPRLQRQPTAQDTAAGRPMASRTVTQGSAWTNASYESDAPLLANAGYAGFPDDGRNSPAPTRPDTAFSRQTSQTSLNRPPPSRDMTPGAPGAPPRTFTPLSRMDTQTSQRSYSPMSRMDSNQSRQPMGPRMPIRTNTGMSLDQEPRSATTPLSAQSDYYGQGSRGPVRQNTTDTYASAPIRQDSQASFQRSNTALSRQPTFASMHSHSSSFSRPMPPGQRKPSQGSFNQGYPQNSAESLQSSESYEMTSQPTYAAPTSAIDRKPSNSGYVAFNPGMHSASSTPVNQSAGPQRSVTVSNGPGAEGNYFGSVRAQAPQRSFTAPVVDNRATIGYSDIVDDYGNDDEPVSRPAMPVMPQRSATASPHALQQQQQQHGERPWQQNRF